MDSRIMFRQLLRAPSTSRAILAPPLRPQTRAFALFAPTLPQPRYISLPRIVQPSFWASLIPKPFKERSERPRPKEWNPATPYIILGLLVGSQAIQIIWLKQEHERNTRRAEAKIGVLREVIERVQRGEDVDVEKVLGTGDPAAEKEWAEVMKEIADEEVLFESRNRRRAQRQAAAKKKQNGEDPTPSPPEQPSDTTAQDGKVKVETVNGAKFF